jgi:nucleoside-diphosphate-sugar epimerase
MRIFLAGASGEIGRRLLPMLRDAGHAVTGTTRSAAKSPAIEAPGARAVVVDVFDAAVPRFIAQSNAFAHADPLDLAAQGARAAGLRPALPE